ncbi:hypothetical protein KSP40_PGU001319 [Platanthera guangdongensis]|uniref:Uncharacterized protein n=1 Tax=Platanthera guangdongensis TaxID=2320717 RepID=A0ABR2M5W3_9ASPA
MNNLLSDEWGRQEPDRSLFSGPGRASRGPELGSPRLAQASPAIGRRVGSAGPALARRSQFDTTTSIYSIYKGELDLEKRDIEDARNSHQRQVLQQMQAAREMHQMQARDDPEKEAGDGELDLEKRDIEDARNSHQRQVLQQMQAAREMHQMQAGDDPEKEAGDARLYLLVSACASILHPELCCFHGLRSAHIPHSISHALSPALSFRQCTKSSFAFFPQQ